MLMHSETLPFFRSCVDAGRKECTLLKKICKGQYEPVAMIMVGDGLHVHSADLRVSSRSFQLDVYTEREMKHRVASVGRYDPL
jgi:hypothetical protein